MRWARISAAQAMTDAQEKTELTARIIHLIPIQEETSDHSILQKKEKEANTNCEKAGIKKESVRKSGHFPYQQLQELTAQRASWRSTRCSRQDGRTWARREPWPRRRKLRRLR